MSERDARRPEVRLTPPPRISAVGPKRESRSAAGGVTPAITPRHRAGRPAWAVPAAIGLLALVAGGGFLLVKMVVPSTPAVEKEARIDGPAVESEATAPVIEPESSEEPVVEAVEPPLATDRGAESPPSPAEEPVTSGPAVREPARGATAPGAALAPTPEALSAGFDPAFGRELAAGLAAIDREEWEAAGAALDRAEAIRSGTAEVARARARIAAGATASELEGRLGRAQQAVDDERWRDAATEWSAALAIDPTLTRAREGAQVAEGRAEMAELLDYHVANPDRLVSAEVLAEAEALLEEASEVPAPGPRHARQTKALDQLLSTARVPVRVSLRSDQETEVTVYKVGRLGTFSQRDLDLRPGVYTIVGSRAGYRDVRHQLRVRPGASPEPLWVRCEEKI